MSNIGDNINIICLESEALKSLVKQLTAELKDEDYPWIDEKEAMLLLRISSKTTFQKYRDTGNIDFRRVSKKHIVYRRQSILDFIEGSGIESKAEDHE